MLGYIVLKNPFECQKRDPKGPFFVFTAYLKTEEEKIYELWSRKIPGWISLECVGRAWQDGYQKYKRCGGYFHHPSLYRALASVKEKSSCYQYEQAEYVEGLRCAEGAEMLDDSK